MIKNAGIIGTGRVARHLAMRLKEEGYTEVFMANRSRYVHGSDYRDWGSRIFSTEDRCEELLRLKPDIVFLAISTTDNGETARDYIKFFASRMIPVVTCEKGSLSHWAHKLEPHMTHVGYSASVGGGTRMLQYLQSCHPNKCDKIRIEAVVNGTLNFVFDEMSRGQRTIGEACQEAIHLGYAEPGSHNPLDMINGELRDTVMKTSVIFNTVISHNRFITPTELDPVVLTVNQLERLTYEDELYRMIVSFSKRTTERPRNYFGNRLFHACVDGWQIEGGFLRVGREHAWIPGGVGNAVHIIVGELGAGGMYTLSGPGAGLEPTTTAMFGDAQELLERERE